MVKATADKKGLLKQYSIVFLLCLFPALIKSQTVVNINDTTIERGVVSEILIYGALSTDIVSDLSLTIQFNSLHLDVIAVIGDNSFIMNCENPDFSLDYTNLTKVNLTINCNDINPKVDGILCKLIVEALAAPDSVSVIHPIMILVNGEEPPDTSFKAGIITAPGIPVLQTSSEGIGENFPNPFNENTTFPISIEEATKLNFYIYSGDGRYLFSNENSLDLIELSIFRNNIQIPNENIEKKFIKGNYELRLTPDINLFASGSYYLILKTENGLYSRKFIYLK